MQKLVVLVALIIGAMVGYFGQSLLSSKGDAADSAAEITKLRETNAALLAKMESSPPATKGKLPSAILPSDGGRETIVDGPVTITSGGVSGKSLNFDLGALGEKMEKQQRKQDDRRIALELAELKTRLNLSPEQEAKIRALLEARAQNKRGGFTKILDLATTGEGEASAVIDTLVADGSNTFDDDLLALLDDEQKADYETFTAEKRANAAEAAASRDLASLQSMLSLTESQKDQAFDAFAKIAADEGGDESDAPGIGKFISMGKQRKKRLAALEPILSPEQMDVYKNSPAASNAMIFGAGDFGGLGGSGAVIQSIQIDATGEQPILLDGSGAE